LQISQIIWPSAPCGSALSPEANALSAKLTNLFYSEEIKILKLRGFRNHFEHFDSRIEEWAKKNTDSIIVDSNIVPSYIIAGYSKIARMRNFDPDTFELTFRNQKYRFLEAVNAAKKIIRSF
jgi:hypothetical protein